MGKRVERSFGMGSVFGVSTERTKHKGAIMDEYGYSSANPEGKYVITWGQGGYDHTMETDAYVTMCAVAEALSKGNADWGTVMVTNSESYAQRQYLNGLIKWTDAGF
jgi:hypothetical protein